MKGGSSAIDSIGLSKELNNIYNMKKMPLTSNGRLKSFADRDKDTWKADFMNTDLIKAIEKIEPSPTEAIVIRYNFDNINLADAKKLHDYVVSTFPDNAVLSIPDYASLRSCSKESLNNIIGGISEIIDGLQSG